MDLLVVPVPFFDENMAVKAYFFQYQEGNGLLRFNQAERAFDGIMLSPLMATLNAVGIDAFTLGLPIFVPINKLTLLANLSDQCKVAPEKVIFVMQEDVKPEEPYLSAIKNLKGLGFRFALQNIQRVDHYAEVARLCDFIFFNHQLMHKIENQLMFALVRRDFQHMTIAMTDIETKEDYDKLKTQGPAMFEGRFYRIPLTKGTHKISPLKFNLIKLLNTVRADDFEFSEVAAIVQQDTALTVSLMKMINSPFLGLRQKVNSINHAVTILGQIEVKKWVTTAVSKLLGSDRPDELTRLSLIRARFAENLAPKFKIEEKSESLFLVGLFSVLDVILELSMEEALGMLRVSDDIRDALLYGKGDYGFILNFIQKYEAAEFKSVSRALIVHDLQPDDIYEAYINALVWYRGVITGTAD
ncbi:MAG: HDOD domain-containing protein [Defluviitaleaceae bacterium]|nr:HDOD domain-containing protein [Defluviitaleaceae bacterium]